MPPRRARACPTVVEVDGLPAAGQDSLQALIIAFEFLRDRVPQLARQIGVEAQWLGERQDVVFYHLQRVQAEVEVTVKLRALLRETVEIAALPVSEERRTRLQEIGEMTAGVWAPI